MRPKGMNETTRVDFHCHSIYSDGTLAPRELARQLAAHRVEFAALADHDTLEGLETFRQAVSARGIGVINAVEITTRLDGNEAHLLAYGFDPDHHELRATLASLRQFQAPAAGSVEGSIRGRGAAPRSGESAVSADTAAPGGRITTEDAIALIHRAAGKAFLAHPLTTIPDLQRLRSALGHLKQWGLDGIEAYYGPYPEALRDELAAIAGEMDLLVSGGSDAHEARTGNGRPFGVGMPTEAWKAFRDAVCSVGSQPQDARPVAPARVGLRRRHIFFHVVVPTLLAITLFAVALYAVFLPAFEKSLMDRKREMIRELTNSAWSILAGYERDVQAGRLTREQAQEMAISRIEMLRYGSEGKDYFWLQDMHPRMIMHPYRKDLNGKDVSGFQDARGNRIFQEFAEVVRNQQEGYVDYVWQWKDDPTRLAPKESYVRGYEPWGWIIGTGLYTEDVSREIAQVERRLLLTSLGISALVAFLLLYVLKQSLRIERERREAEEGLRESTQRYQSLVEATTDGTLLVLGGRCRYANPMLLDLLGCTAAELELLDLEDVLPHIRENEQAWRRIAELLEGDESSEGFDGTLRRRNGTLVDCALGLSRIPFAARGGLILLAKPVGVTPPEGTGSGPAGDRQHGAVSEDLPAGLLRALATSKGTVISASASARKLLGYADRSGTQGHALSDLFPDGAAYARFLAGLLRDGRAETQLHLSGSDLTGRVLSLRAVLVTDDRGQGRYVDAVIEDVTVESRREAERENLINRLQGSMLFLHEPVGQAEHAAVFCDLNTPVRTVAYMMSSAHTGAVLVRAQSGDVVGIFTDRDLRERVVAAGADLDSPVYRFMSSPLITVLENAEICEALALIDQAGVHHLVVVDETGRATGVVRGQELLRYPSYGPLVLAAEVSRASRVEEVVTACRRAPGFARSLLESGAHPDRVTRMLTSVCDAACERFIAFARDRIGPAPAPYVFLALGSQGRQEQVLSSDQDNAIIYAAEAADDPTVAEYFQQMGSLVCGWLDRAGYPYCKGEVMAQNPRWCKPLDVWKGYFSEWIRGGEAQQALEFSIFFDLRPVSGASELAAELRAHVYEELSANPAFLMYLAQNTLQYKPPVRIFGRILSGGGGPDQAGQINLKDALIPLVSFARLYALRHRLDNTHTLDRLNALQQAGVITDASRDETATAWEQLTRLRLRQQADARDAGQPLDNLISYRRISQLDMALLNQAFAQIGAIQNRISHDFLGDAQTGG